MLNHSHEFHKTFTVTPYYACNDLYSDLCLNVFHNVAEVINYSLRRLFTLLNNSGSYSKAGRCNNFK